ncbi:translation initiation factor IF-1 [Candidatus Wolfebacteria bacterium RIFCSPHIGHO2_01_FULL_48_22]|uniref:Translation initiation factor IF-1 n=2 Tax=Candidatus Wolfeibacteriota TaxID=1752735 RepID=A0A1F8DR99_9BACT|nr:MAG: translation initiation factor IF-1 [Candidatus Wolfebacteria bacterium RIFCSPHIGHO2_01_FULL_48_22]OGM91997.1 MAG: translation initiation factor IF-1 [Candidatus Wolfebacteria bacterium RIFCSPLOWO2_01_FULL_47_17b]
MAREKLENLVQGIVTETLPSTMFRVQIDNKEVLAHLSGKMRIHYIKVLPGDTVLVKISPDGNRGIIMRRI